MRHFVSGPLPDRAHNLMRKIGYAAHVGRDHQPSFVKRLHQTPYPRYHAYVEERGDGMSINLHLDQKQASYEGVHAHSGEYEGSAVEREMKRVLDAIAQLKQVRPAPAQTNKPEKKREWWQIILGG